MTKDLMIASEVDTSKCGVVTYWELSGLTDGERLRDALDLVPLDLHDQPTDTSPAAALRRALCEVNDAKLLRPMRGTASWAVVREMQHGTGTDADLDFAVLYRVTVKDTVAGTALAFSFKDSPLNEAEQRSVRFRLEAEYDDQLALLSHSEVSSWLCKLATTTLKAVGLRQRGGIYYVPPAYAQQWRDVAEAVAESTPHVVHMLPAVTNEDALDAVFSAVTSEVDTALNDMTDDIKAGELGVRGWRTRIRSCEALLEKLAAYDGLLGGALDGLKDRARSTKLQVMRLEAASKMAKDTA